MAANSDVSPGKEPYKKTILVLSVLIPLAVALIFGMPK